jgi:hypothetical protein
MFGDALWARPARRARRADEHRDGPPTDSLALLVPLRPGEGNENPIEAVPLVLEATACCASLWSRWGRRLFGGEDVFGAWRSGWRVASG